METRRYIENLIESKIAVSDEFEKSQVIRILCRIIYGNCNKAHNYFRQGFNYFFIGEDSIKMTRNPETFKKSHYKEISVEEVLNPKLERAFMEEELLKALEKNGCWIESKYSLEKFLIVRILGSFITIVDTEIRRISVDALVNHYQFLNGKPCGVSLTLEEALQNL